MLILAMQLSIVKYGSLVSCQYAATAAPAVTQAGARHCVDRTLCPPSSFAYATFRHLQAASHDCDGSSLPVVPPCSQAHPMHAEMLHT